MILKIKYLNLKAGYWKYPFFPFKKIDRFVCLNPFILNRNLKIGFLYFGINDRITNKTKRLQSNYTSGFIKFQYEV